MTGLAVRFGIVFFLGLGILACATTTASTPAPQPTIDNDIRTASARWSSATKTAPAPRTVVPTKTKQAPYSVMVRGGEVVCRGIAYEYVNMAELGKTTALQHVANTIYIRLNAPLVYVSARDAENALAECRCFSTQNCEPLGIGATPTPAPGARPLQRLGHWSGAHLRAPLAPLSGLRIAHLHLRLLRQCRRRHPRPSITTKTTTA